MTPLNIGEFRIQRVTETEGPFAPLEFVLPAVDLAKVQAQASWVRPRYLSADNKLVMGFYSYVLSTGRHHILVDSCVGNDKERPTRASWHRQDYGYLQALERAGLQPEDIDFVCCTHLHADHVGWNTQIKDGRWVPTFPKARYVFGRTEYAHWETAHREALASATEPPNHGSFADSALPVVEAGRADLVAEDFEFEQGVYLRPAFGHTPGNCCLHVKSQGAQAVFSGDIFHTPVQLIDLSWSSRFCHDAGAAEATRRQLVESIADTSTVLLGAHFPTPTAGRVASAGEGFKWVEEA